MNERFKEIRQYFNLSQEAFGKRLGVQKSSISKVEKGINGMTEQMLLSVCREFDINEEWLRTGQGKMFVELSKEELVAGLVAKKIKSGNPFILNTFIALGKLNDDEWLVVEKIINEVASQYDKTKYDRKELDGQTEKESN